MTRWLFLLMMGTMFHSLSVLFSFLLICAVAGAETPQQTFMKQFGSSRFELITPGSKYVDSPERYPWVGKMLFNHVFNWTPTGEKKKLSPGCATDVWQERMLDPRLKSSLQLQGALVQKYFAECKAELETGINNPTLNSVKMLSVEYQLKGHPFLQRVMLNLPGNIKLSGLLALKGDLKRRPFVIVRVGIFSHLTDFRAERAWLGMLFEQSPFNLLVVENLSSPDFIANNTQFSLGGYDEGLQNILIAKLLNDPNEPISKIIDSVHMFGISLGGHGMLFASLLNKYNSPPKKPLIRSFIGMCPVVNLHETFDKLTESGLRSRIVDLWIQNRLGDLAEKMPALREHEVLRFTRKVVDEIARTYKGGMSYVSTIKLPPGMQDSNDFWKVNNYWPYYSQVQEPVMIFANQNDPVVPFRENSERLQKKIMKIDSQNISVTDFPYGVHCTLPVSYDWSAMSTLLSSYFLSHSTPEFKMSEKSLDVVLNDKEWVDFLDVQTTVSFKVTRPEVKAKFASIVMSFENSRKQAKSLNLSLPLADFDFRFLNDELSKPEQDMIVRWVNQNLRLSLDVKAAHSVVKASWRVAQ